MGVLLGGLFLLSGSLPPAILAHALTNHVTMRYLAGDDDHSGTQAPLHAHGARPRRL